MYKKKRDSYEALSIIILLNQTLIFFPSKNFVFYIEQRILRKITDIEYICNCMNSEDTKFIWKFILKTANKWHFYGKIMFYHLHLT